jgi:hypothetical protein
MEKNPVKKANNFSKFVFAKIFPTVLRMKIAKKIHNMIFTT